MSQESSQFVFRSATRFLSGTVLSRISGLLRDMTMAFCLGTSSSLAAFLVAYRFIYLLRRLFGEGLLHQGFIPHFEAMRRLDERGGALFFRNLFLFLAGFLVALLLVIGVILGQLKGQTAQLALYMLPGVLFLCLYGLSTGLLQAEKSFFLPAASPVIFNLIWIVGVLAFYRQQVNIAVQSLAITLSIAFFAQWLMTVPHLWKYLKSQLSSSEIWTLVPAYGHIKPLISPLVLGIAGVASMQINSAIDAIFARFADPQGPAYLWYAIRLQQLPLALFGVALSAALLPSLSRAVEGGDGEGYFNLISCAQKRIFSLVFPCTIGIFVLGLSSVNLLFGRGDFTLESTLQTTQCLWGYGWGLMPAAFVQVLAPGFYAKKDYRTPAVGFVFSSLLNIVLNAFFVFVLNWHATSIALATSIAAFANAIYLLIKLKRPLPLKNFLPLGLCTLMAGGVTLAFNAFCLNGEISRNFSSQALSFALQTSLYFLSFFSFCKIMRVEERKHWALWKEF